VGVVRSLAMLVLLAACGGGQARTAPNLGPHHGHGMGHLMVFDVAHGSHATLADVGTAALAARAVYIGEQHTDPHHHLVELRVLAEIYYRDHDVALGLEMVQRPFQAALDAYVRGEIGDEELQRRIEWQKRWGFDWDLYQPIFDFARAHKIPIVALNARKEITHRIAQVGVDGLTPEEKQELPELDLTNARHKAMVKEEMGEGHGGMGDSASFDRMYAAQVTWDETMADSVARRMAAPGAPHRMVVLAGYGHVREGLGIPQRAARRGVTPFVTVMPAARDEVAEAVADKVADWVVSW
jgi:uncharacterized iron-regulated protein